MNLRIEQQQFRFRISKEELAALCNDTPLTQQTALPGQQMLKVEICAKAHPEILRLNVKNGHIELVVQKEAADELYRSLPSREGLTVQQCIDSNQSLTLMLEVDIRTQKRKRSVA